jgi:hypothetical protein
MRSTSARSGRRRRRPGVRGRGPPHATGRPQAGSVRAGRDGPVAPAPRSAGAPADPHEPARCLLPQRPAALVLEPVVVPAHRAEVRIGGRPPEPVVDGVVEVGAVRRARAAGTDTRAVAHDDPPREGRTREPARRVAPRNGAAGVLPGPQARHDVAAHRFPGRCQLAGQLLETGELRERDPQFDDVAAASTVDAVLGSSAREVDEEQVTGLVHHDHPPLGPSTGSDQHPESTGCHRTPARDHTGARLRAQQRRQRAPHLDRAGAHPRRCRCSGGDLAAIRILGVLPGLGFLLRLGVVPGPRGRRRP